MTEQLEQLGIAFPGSAAADISFEDGSPWRMTSLEVPADETTPMLVKTALGSIPARPARLENSLITIRLEMEPQESMEDAQDHIGALDLALTEAERVASEGQWVDPGLDLARLIWTAWGSERTLGRPFVAGKLTVPKELQGDDAGYFLDKPSPVVTLVVEAWPGWFGDYAELVALTGTDAYRIAGNTAVAFDVDPPGGDLPPWVDLTVTEDDSHARHSIVISAESPATGDSDYIAADDLTTTGYGGVVSSGALSANSPDWMILAEIPAQSHDRRRTLIATSVSGTGSLKVIWQSGGVQRESNVISIPQDGYQDLPICPVQGEWTGVVAGIGDVSLRGLRFDGLDGRALARSPLVASGMAGDLTHYDDLLSISGALNGKTLTEGGTWGTSGATTDWSGTADGVSRTTTVDASARIGLAGPATPDWVQGVGFIRMSAGAAGAWPQGSGYIYRYVSTSNFVWLGVTAGDSGPALKLIRVIGGTAVVLAERAVGAPALIGSPGQGIPAAITLTEQGVWKVTYGSWSESGQDVNLGPSGTLATGRVGLYDRHSGAANTRLLWGFNVRGNPWRTAPILPAAGDLRLAGGVLLGAGQETPFRGNGLVDLSPQEPSRIYVAAKRGREAVASVAANETDNLEVSVHARPRYKTVPALAPEEPEP